MNDTDIVKAVEEHKGEAVGFSPSYITPENGHPKFQYTRPDDVSDFTEVECDDAIKKVMADVKADSAHPLMDKTNPLHKDFKRYYSELHEIRAAAREGNPTQFDKWEKEQQEKQQREQSKRIQSAQWDMDVCVNSGEFQRAEIPVNISESQCKMLKCQRLIAEGRLDEVNSLIHDSFRELKVSPERVQAYDMMLTITESESDKLMHANSIIKFLDEKYKESKVKPKGFNPKRFGG